MAKELWIVFCDDDYGIFEECTGKSFKSEEEANTYCERMNSQHAPAFFYTQKVTVRKSVLPRIVPKNIHIGGSKVLRTFALSHITFANTFF